MNILEIMGIPKESWTFVSEYLEKAADPNEETFAVQIDGNIIVEREAITQKVIVRYKDMQTTITPEEAKQLSIELDAEILTWDLFFDEKADKYVERVLHEDRDYRLMEALHGGFDVNKQNEYGNTLLHIALENEHFEGIINLLKRKANVEIANKQGQTAWDYAKLWGYEQVFQALAEFDIIPHYYEVKKNG